MEHQAMHVLGAHKEAVVAVTQPILDALDEAYSIPLDGTGLFPLQALTPLCRP